MDTDSIRVTRSVIIPRSEIDLRFSRSSGPGGQHAQKTETRVEALFDVEASSALSPIQKRRVVARTGPVLRAVAQDERSQMRNRELAVERLVVALREALTVERRRRPTTPSRAARERRLESKRQRAQTEQYKEVRKQHPRIERKLADLIRWHGGRRVRYRGLLRAKIQYFLTAVAVNFKRLVKLYYQPLAVQPI